MSNEPRPRQAVVTGSSSGIGLAIAQALLDGGWHVAGLDVAPPTLDRPSFTPLAVDLADGPALERAAAGLQGVDALVHAAGVLRVGPLGRLDAAAGALMWQLHVDAATRLANALVPAMADRGQGAWSSSAAAWPRACRGAASTRPPRPRWSPWRAAGPWRWRRAA